MKKAWIFGGIGIVFVVIGILFSTGLMSTITSTESLYYNYQCEDITEYLATGYTKSSIDQYGCDIVTKRVLDIKIYSRALCYRGYSSRNNKCPAECRADYGSDFVYEGIWKNTANRKGYPICSRYKTLTEGGRQRVVNQCDFDTGDILYAQSYTDTGDVIRVNETDYPVKGFCRAIPAIVTNDITNNGISSTEIYHELAEGRGVTVEAGKDITIFYIIEGSDFLSKSGALDEKINEINNLNLQLEYAGADISILTYNLETLFTEKEDLSTAINSLELEKTQLDLVINDLDIEVKDKVKLISELNVELKVQQDIANQLQLTLEEEKQIVIDLSSNIDEQKILISILEKTSESQILLIKDLEWEIEAQAEYINELTTNLQEKAKLISLLTVENEVQAELIKQMEVSFEKQGIIISGLNNEIEDDKIIIQSLTDSYEEQVEIINGMNLNIVELKSVIADMELSIHEFDELVYNLKATADEKEQLVNEYSKSLAISEEKLDILLDKYSSNKEKTAYLSIGIYILIAVLLLLAIVLFFRRKK